MPRLTTPRVAPLDPKDWAESVRDVAGSNPRGEDGVMNIFATLANHPDLMRRWLVFGNHVLFKSTLPPREREIAILRIGWLCQAEYEWAQHVVIARQCDITDEEISRVAEGPDAPGWAPHEVDLLRAVDELHADAFITQPTWKKLAERWNTQELMDLVFAVGQYKPGVDGAQHPGCSTGRRRRRFRGNDEAWLGAAPTSRQSQEAHAEQQGRARLRGHKDVRARDEIREEHRAVDQVVGRVEDQEGERIFAAERIECSSDLEHGIETVLNYCVEVGSAEGSHAGIVRRKGRDEFTIQKRAENRRAHRTLRAILRSRIRCRSEGC